MPKFTISAKAKKASKKAAYDMAVKLKQGKTLSDFELDSLLLYFAPSIPKTAKTSLEWVAKAAAINDVRQPLNFIRVQDGYAYGTDGMRLHKAPSDLPTGYYCPKTFASVSLDIKPPRYAEMLRSGGLAREQVTVGELARGMDGKNPYLMHRELKTAVHEAHLADALNGLTDESAIEYDPAAYGVHSYHIRGFSEFGEWLLAPMRVTL